MCGHKQEPRGYLHAFMELSDVMIKMCARVWQSSRLYFCARVHGAFCVYLLVDSSSSPHGKAYPLVSVTAQLQLHVSGG